MLLNKSHLCVRKVVSKEENRFTLNGLLVDPAQYNEDGSVKRSARTVATDGHRLMIVEDPAPLSVDSFPELPGGVTAAKTHDRFLLPKAAADEIVKILPKKTTIPVLQNAAVVSVDDDHIRLAVTDLERADVKLYRKLTGNFPDYERIMPKLEDMPFSIRLDGNYHAVDALKEGGFLDERRPAITMHFRNAKEACIITGQANEQGMTARYVLMPIRKDEGDPKDNAAAAATALPDGFVRNEDGSIDIFGCVRVYPDQRISWDDSLCEDVSDTEPGEAPGGERLTPDVEPQPEPIDPEVVTEDDELPV